MINNKPNFCLSEPKALALSFEKNIGRRLGLGRRALILTFIDHITALQARDLTNNLIPKSKMLQEFEMTADEMESIKNINKTMPPVMKIGDHWSGMDLRDKINAYWRDVLGEKYGFIWSTVQPSSKGGLYFLAVPFSNIEEK